MDNQTILYILIRLQAVGLVLSILGIIMGIVLAFGAMSVVANMDSSEMDMLQQELIEELESEGYNIPSDALSLG